MGVLRGWAWSAAAVGLGLAAGCATANAFECTSDSQCVGASGAGQCEATGFCSFPDAECPSGRRYGAFAGGGLANQCVNDPGTDSLSSLGGSSSSSTTSAPGPTPPDSDPSSSSSDGGSSGPPPPVCGDGNVDRGEACDDGNAEAGDGCNPDCVVSGTRLCAHQVRGGAGFGSTFRSVVSIGDDFVVVGWGDTPDQGEDAVVRRYDIDCNEVWTATHDGEGVDDDLFAVAASDDVIWAVGSESLASDRDVLVLRYTLEGDLIGATRGSAERAFGVALTESGGALVAGHQGTSATSFVLNLAEFDADGLELGDTASQSTLADRALALAVNGKGESYVAGARGVNTNVDASLVVDRLTEGTFVNLVTVDPELTIAVGQAIGVTEGGDFYVGGFVNNGPPSPMGLSPVEAFLGRFNASGDEIWSDRFNDGNGEVEGLAVAANGDVLVVGIFGPDPDSNDLDHTVRRYTATGDLRWEVLMDHAGAKDVARGVALGPAGEVIVVGEVTEADALDAWVGVLAP